MQPEVLLLLLLLLLPQSQQLGRGPLAHARLPQAGGWLATALPAPKMSLPPLMHPLARAPMVTSQSLPKHGLPVN